MTRLKDLRIKKGLLQKDLAELVGVTGNAISNYEAGLREPNIETLIKIAIVLETTVDDLVEFREIHDKIGEDLLMKIKKMKEPIN